jgi:hypothetical protein
MKARYDFKLQLHGLQVFSHAHVGYAPQLWVRLLLILTSKSNAMHHDLAVLVLYAGFMTRAMLTMSLV